MNDTVTLDMREISRGVAEVYDGAHQVGLITWNPDRMITQWFATYANGDETVACASRGEAVESLQLQHAVVRRLARSIRSIRPATSVGPDYSQLMYDRGYNSALRDVERLLQEVVGQAPEGEGFTATTRPAN